MNRVKRPCAECPWRKDAEPHRFTEERWDALAASSADERGMGPEFGTPLFACHKTPEGEERACAGWLAQEGANHPNVRLDVRLGHTPVSALTPREGWPDLHETFHQTRAHDMQET